MKDTIAAAQDISTHWLDLAMTFIHFTQRDWRTLNFKGEKKWFKIIKISDMTVMQTTALKINDIPKLWWVIISVISIDQQHGCVKFPYYCC